MKKLVDEIMFKLLATSIHPDREWLEGRMSEGLNDIVGEYGLYIEHTVVDEITSDIDLNRMSFSEWLVDMDLGYNTKTRI
tara:strand:+ start:2109 stop:2348 length:240 start_codon:yes stop_codon:yes gene_type:complete